MIHTIRILLRYEDDDSAFFDFFKHYEVPLEGAEFMWSQYVAYYKDNHIAPCHALAAGLGSFAKSPHWESFLRTPLRHGVDLHVPLTGTSNTHVDHQQEVYPWPLREDPKLLDELFTNTQTPVDAKLVGDKWLQILASEGYDVLVYLQAEKDLRASQQQLTYPCYPSKMYDIPRRLQFNLGPTLSVFWDCSLVSVSLGIPPSA